MEEIRNYFNAERAESIIFIAIGIVAIGLSIYFFSVLKKPFYSGVAYPLAIIALIQIAVGSGVFIRSPKDITRVENMVATEKSKIATDEIPRMNTVMKNFEIYRWVEIFLIVAGLVMMFAFADRDLIKGIGVGLFAQSSIMLLLDFFAEKRGLEYLKFVQSLI